jgi:ribosome-binding protein aMBF1 (putative translation factor)
MNRSAMMIKNERQYRMTKTQADKFAQALALTERRESAPGVHPLLQRAETDALRSQLESLRQEIAAYEDLRSGKEQVFVSHSLDALPEALIKARIAAGLSQKDLAERLGLKEQQVQKYEATDYTSASLERVRAVIRALGVTVKEEVSIAAQK